MDVSTFDIDRTEYPVPTSDDERPHIHHVLALVAFCYGPVCYLLNGLVDDSFSVFQSSTAAYHHRHAIGFSHTEMNGKGKRIIKRRESAINYTLFVSKFAHNIPHFVKNANELFAIQESLRLKASEREADVVVEDDQV